MTLPVVALSGPPFAQGFAHGGALKDRISQNLAIYFRRFEREARLPRAEVARRASLYWEALEARSPAYAENLRGVASGSGFPLLDLVALNVRYELIYCEVGRIALADEGVEKASGSPRTNSEYAPSLGGAPRPDGCTAFAIPPRRAANRHLLLGENWDWIPGVRGAVLRTTEPDGLETLSFTEAGIVGGKIGLNSMGMGLAINGLSSSDDDWSRLAPPFHLRCYEALRHRDLESALRVVALEPHSVSAHFLLAQTPDRVVSVETTPQAVKARPAADGCVHANHFLDPAALGVVETSAEDRAHSCRRQARLEALLAAKTVDFAQVCAALRDHLGYPNSVCWHPDAAVPPDEQYATVVSVVMDLTARTMDLSDGPPCQAGYKRLGVGGPESGVGS